MDRPHITPENLQFVLNALETKQYNLECKIDVLEFRYRESLNCEHLNASNIGWLEIDSFLKRNPTMKFLVLQGLQGEQVNDLLKQWINGEGIDLETLLLFTFIGYPDNVTFDDITTMDTKLT
ncbi:hypothetical protein B9Z55_015574 [Caenorhabditis nigoni]|uniref:F-box associated domain-containing protein n=1 Tax=Caenorhabditis nigoni TaxID=1611254 RepID=A0A2G5UAT3_9PELO|nr:hypothetical protein B9Z55_015574 [Caenorhabditis nigoni]